MRMVRSAHNDGINILFHLVKHDTIVTELCHFRELTETSCRSFFVDVTKGDDILAGDSP